MTADRREAARRYRPRPALGRRPWFAFLRRAWILRRFALAMGGEGTRPRSRAITLVAGDWSSGPLLVPSDGAGRRRGLAPVPGPFGILLPGRSVVGWGMTAPLRWCGLTATGEVVATGTVRPRCLVIAPAAVRWMVETGVHVSAPPLGIRLRAVPILASWPAD